MITEVGTVFRTARERSLSITTRPRDFQGTSALRRLHGDRGVGAAASVDLIVVVVVTSVVGVSSTVEEGAVVFLVEVVGIVGVAVLVVGEEVGVVVGSVDFVAVEVSVDGGRTECRVTNDEWPSLYLKGEKYE
jgi:hypothetical protein